MAGKNKHERRFWTFLKAKFPSSWKRGRPKIATGTPGRNSGYVNSTPSSTSTAINNTTIASQESDIAEVHPRVSVNAETSQSHQDTVQGPRSASLTVSGGILVADPEAKQSSLQPSRFMLIGVERMNEYNIKLVEEALHSVVAVDMSGDVLGKAIAKMNNATILLSRIISFLKGQLCQNTDNMPILNEDNLEKSIEDASNAIQRLIEANETAKANEAAKHGILYEFGKEIKSICVNLKPFVKTFLSIGINACAVRLIHG